MTIGAPVVVTAQWSTFRGQRGIVVATSPRLMVQLKGERLPLAFGESEVTPASERSHMTAGE